MLADCSLAEIIDRHGLTEFRPTIAMLLDRAEDTALEIAVFGRVSTGKSSLLNHMIGANLLPVGVTPITAVPTRIGYGQNPLVRVWQEGLGTSEHTVEELPSYVDERLNPENHKRVGRILVLLSVGAAARRNHLCGYSRCGIAGDQWSGGDTRLFPRCDAGIVLVDAGSTLVPDDLRDCQRIDSEFDPTTVLVSKADLLSPADLEQQIAYMKRQLQANSTLTCG